MNRHDFINRLESRDWFDPTMIDHQLIHSLFLVLTKSLYGVNYEGFHGSGATTTLREFVLWNKNFFPILYIGPTWEAARLVLPDHNLSRGWQCSIRGLWPRPAMAVIDNIRTESIRNSPEMSAKMDDYLKRFPYQFVNVVQGDRQ